MKTKMKPTKLTKEEKQMGKENTLAGWDKVIQFQFKRMKARDLAYQFFCLVGTTKSFERKLRMAEALQVQIKINYKTLEALRTALLSPKNAKHIAPHIMKKIQDWNK